MTKSEIDGAIGDIEEEDSAYEFARLLKEGVGRIMVANGPDYVVAFSYCKDMYEAMLRGGEHIRPVCQRYGLLPEEEQEGPIDLAYLATQPATLWSLLKAIDNDKALEVVIKAAPTSLLAEAATDNGLPMKVTEKATKEVIRRGVDSSTLALLGRHGATSDVMALAVSALNAPQGS